MNSFLQHAEQIFETASQGGPEDCHLAILVGRDGGIHMLPASGWDLGCLRQHHGAASAFRVTRTGARIQVDARTAGQSCSLRNESFAGLLRPALPPQYLLA